MEHFVLGHWLLVLAYLTSVVGCALGSASAVQARYATVPRHRMRWLVLAAVSIGGVGVWLMHFVAMLGFSTPGMPIRYDIFRTVLSAILSVTAVFAGLLVVCGRAKFGWWRLALGALFTGLAVNLMHYTGMAALWVKGDFGYDGVLAGLSGVFAVAATAALWFAGFLDRLPLRLLAGFVMGAAVTGMHYTDMAAVRMTMDPNAPDPAGAEVLVPVPSVRAGGDRDAAVRGPDGTAGRCRRGAGACHRVTSAWVGWAAPSRRAKAPGVDQVHDKRLEPTDDDRRHPAGEGDGHRRAPGAQPPEVVHFGQPRGPDAESPEDLAVGQQAEGQEDREVLRDAESDLAPVGAAAPEDAFEHGRARDGDEQPGGLRQPGGAAEQGEEISEHEPEPRPLEHERADGGQDSEHGIRILRQDVQPRAQQAEQRPRCPQRGADASTPPGAFPRPAAVERAEHQLFGRDAEPDGGPGAEGVLLELGHPAEAGLEPERAVCDLVADVLPHAGQGPARGARSGQHAEDTSAPPAVRGEDHGRVRHLRHGEQRPGQQAGPRDDDRRSRAHQ